MKPTRMNSSGKVLKGWKHKPAKAKPAVDPNASLVKVPKSKLTRKAPPPPVPPSLLSRTPPPFEAVVSDEKKANKHLPPPLPPAKEAKPTDSVGLPGSPERLEAAKKEGMTHMEWRSLPDKHNRYTSVVCPINCHGDFSSLKGTVRFGRMRYGDEFIPNPADATNNDGSISPGENVGPDGSTGGISRRTQTFEPAKTRAKPAGGIKREGVCAFIDALIMKGGHTVEQIRDLTLAQFPGRDPASTLNTVKVRPSRMKDAGKTPPPFAK